MLILARGATTASDTMAGFLLDTFALGVKDAYIKSLSGREFADHLEYASAVTPLIPVDPAYARKFLRDLVAWTPTLGFGPHRDYAKIEPIFGTIDPARCDVEFRFGHEGKPLFIGDISDFGDPDSVAPLLIEGGAIAD